MSKFTPIAVVLTGVGGVTGAYHYTPKHKNKSVNPIVNISFRDKYRIALLNTEENKDVEIWNRKWDLMQGKGPIHPTLKEALKTLNKELHKEACKKIYDSTVLATPYFLDFKNYCSKNNKDGIGGSWILEGTEDKKKPKSKNKWDEKLVMLKEAKREDLQVDLLSLNFRLNSDSRKRKPNQFESKDREELKAWCDSWGTEIFLGEKGVDSKSAKSYCIE